MNRIIIAALFAIISSTVASAGDFATEMVEATFKLFNADSTATCFLVRREAPDQSLYLVTAAHVFDGVKGDTAIVVLRARRDDGSYQRHDYTIAVRHEGKALWVRHPKEDVAALRLSQPPPVLVAALPLSAVAEGDEGPVHKFSMM